MSSPTPDKQPGLFSLLTPYKGLVASLVILGIIANALSLLIPKIIARGIDSYTTHTFDLHTLIWEFALTGVCTFIFTAVQSIVQVYTSERVARDMRARLSAKISEQSYGYVSEVTPAKLLTNLTGDIDSIKGFVSLAVVSIISSTVLIIGTSALLLSINWKLALIVLTIIPLIGGTFSFVLVKVRALFLKSRAVIDRLNKVINESILGSALIRVLDSRRIEHDKFLSANEQAKSISMDILGLFCIIIPFTTFVASLATLAVMTFGGHFVILGTMTLGEFTAFNSYILILIFPIVILGFVSNVIAQASASYSRIAGVLAKQARIETGTLTTSIRGDISIDDVTVSYGEKRALKHVTLSIPAGSKTAIIGPTAGGKTQLLYLLIGLIEPDHGTVMYDGVDMHAYDRTYLHTQIGFVFQDSVMFNLSIRENIAFSQHITDADLQKAIDTAELHDFIDTLPAGLDTVVSERGTSLSGGQKQRIMLARALALNPRILLLDDFTARVDRQTEEKILKNISRNYPDTTLVSVTQKISATDQYDQIILLMESEILATGTHAELMRTSPEYVQIYNSQQSANSYELHT